MRKEGVREREKRLEGRQELGNNEGRKVAGKEGGRLEGRRREQRMNYGNGSRGWDWNSEELRICWED